MRLQREPFGQEPLKHLRHLIRGRAIGELCLNVESILTDPFRPNDLKRPDEVGDNEQVTEGISTHRQSIALNAQPDLKFNYDRRSYGRGGSVF